MTIQRLENVGIVVDDLAAATTFFVELGLKVLVRGRLRAVGWTVWWGSRASAWTSRCWRLRTAMDGSN
jgi:catechol 2,3-dioxygenase-like lactoylglutathione lyase family enzyme